MMTVLMCQIIFIFNQTRMITKMGKYDIATTKHDGDLKYVMLRSIANELAEANRLKRFEMSIGLDANKIPKELEDQA